MLLGTMHHVNTAQATGLHQRRQGPTLVRCMPQIQSRLSTPPPPPPPAAQGHSGWGGGRGTLWTPVEWRPALVPTPPRPSALGGATGSSAPPSPPPPCNSSLFVCELLMPPPLPCLAAAVVEAHEGGSAASSSPTSGRRRQPALGMLGRRGHVPGCGPRDGSSSRLGSQHGSPTGRGCRWLWPQSPVWRLAARTESGLCGLRGAGAHIRALFAEVKGVFVSFWRRDRGRNNFPHSSLIPAFK